MSAGTVPSKPGCVVTLPGWLMPTAAYQIGVNVHLGTACGVSKDRARRCQLCSSSGLSALHSLHTLARLLPPLLSLLSFLFLSLLPSACCCLHFCYWTPAPLDCLALTEGFTILFTSFCLIPGLAATKFTLLGPKLFGVVVAALL